MSNSAVYMDYNATTPLDPEVLDEMIYSMQYTWCNPSSAYQAGITAKKAIEKARSQVADMVRASSNEIIFTSGGTESNNMVLMSVVDDFYEKFSKIPLVITSAIEHDSVGKVLLKLEHENRIKLKRISISSNTGTVNVDELVSSLTEDTALVTVMLANNETGVIQPIQLISKAIREYTDKHQFQNKILLHSDAGQALGKIDISVQDLGVDYLTIVGHKFYGPRIGALYVRNLQTKGKWKIPCPDIPIKSIFTGGGQEGNLRSGTENTPMIVGLGKAAELVSLNIDKYSFHMEKIRSYLETCLLNRFESYGCKILSRFSGSTNRIPNTCNVALVTNFYLTGPEILSNCGRLQASVGAACHSTSDDKQNIHYEGSEILRKCGYSLSECRSAIRLSVGRETSKCEVDVTVEDLFQAVSQCLSKI